MRIDYILKAAAKLDKLGLKNRAGLEKANDGLWGSVFVLEILLVVLLFVLLV